VTETRRNPEDGVRLADRVVRQMLERDAFSRWLGVELLSVAPGSCTLAMTVRDDMLNGFGVSHGGIVFSLADSAMAFACNSGPMVTVAVDNSISYPAAVRLGDRLTAIAERESESAKLAYYRVTVRRADDAVVALFRGTVYRTRTLHHDPAPNG
jgi:acyl-CoA thioesterase